MAAVTLPIVTTYNNKGVTTAQGSLKSLVGSYATVGVASGLLIDGIKSSITAASNLQETVSKNKVIFGDSAKSVEDFAKTAASTFGQSQQQALDAAGTFAIFGKAAGLGAQDLVNFSTDFTVLASDMASFSNTSPEDAITAIGAALRGEAEPIRKYGVLLNDNTLKQRASTLGIYEGTGALTAQQKILATQAEIIAQSSDAQGDFERTSGGLANKTRTLNAEYKNLSATIGAQLLPVATDGAIVLGNVLSVATAKSSEENGKFSKTVFEMVANVIPGVKQLKNMAQVLHLLAGEQETTITSTRNLSRQFRSFENAMLRAYEEGLKPTKEELKDLAAKQDIAEKAAKRHADTLRTRMSTAVKGVQSNLKDAEEQLKSFSNATDDSITGMVSLSEAIRTQDDAAKGVADALKDRKEAYTDVASATKDVNDAMARLIKTQKGDDPDAVIEATKDLTEAKLKLAEANDALAVSETKVNTAQTIQADSTYSKAFQKQITDAKQFASNLQYLLGYGLSKDGLAQLINLGPTAGLEVTADLINGGKGFTLADLNQSLAGLSSSAAGLGLAAGNAFFGGNVAAGQTAFDQAKNYQITVNAGLVSNPAQVGRDIIEAIKSAERLSGQVFVSV
jgi:hypothetical protein